MHKLKVDIPGLLSRLPLFSTIGEDALAAIAAGTREQRLDKGEMLFRKGDMPRGFYVMVHGQVKLAFSSPQGSEKVVEILGAPQSFGEAVLFMEKPYPVFAEALGSALALHIGADAVLQLLDSDPCFARRMLAGMAMRLHALVQDVEAYSMHSGTQRLIGYLLQAAVELPGGGAEVDLPTTKQVLASRLNLTPETFSRVLGDLSGNGLIAVQGRRILIHDLARLSAHQT